MGGQPLRPAATAAALQQGGLGLGGRHGVEAVEARDTGLGLLGGGVLDGYGRPGGRLAQLLREAGAGLAGPGQRGLLGSTASVTLEREAAGETRQMQGEGRDECASKLARRGNGRPTDARTSPGRESFGSPDEPYSKENARLSP
ncbi:hypothetical protein GCM10009647_045720 [Streptomyces sanglieri]